VGISTASAERPTVDQFLVAFDAFAQAVRRARGARAADPDGGLTLSQYGLLEPLADRADARVSELAERAGIAPSTASRILDALERRGIVARKREARDRRGVAVELTRAGAEVLSREHDWLRARQREFFKALPADERALAPDLLLRLAALIDELAAGPD
jgi:DNA-binding MarR family transcriptional regulator